MSLVVTYAVSVETAVGVGAIRAIVGAIADYVTAEGNLGAGRRIPEVVVLRSRNQKREKQNADGRE